jgi:hypothetical protein
MSRIDSLTQIRVRLTHVTTQVSPTSLERIRQAWAGVPMHKMRRTKEKRNACAGVYMGASSSRKEQTLLAKGLLTRETKSPFCARDADIFLQASFTATKRPSQGIHEVEHSLELIEHVSSFVGGCRLMHSELHAFSKVVIEKLSQDFEAKG